VEVQAVAGPEHPALRLGYLKQGNPAPRPGYSCEFSEQSPKVSDVSKRKATGQTVGASIPEGQGKRVRQDQRGMGFGFFEHSGGHVEPGSPISPSH